MSDLRKPKPVAKKVKKPESHKKRAKTTKDLLRVPNTSDPNSPEAMARRRSILDHAKQAQDENKNGTRRSK